MGLYGTLSEMQVEKLGLRHPAPLLRMDQLPLKLTDSVSLLGDL